MSQRLDRLQILLKERLHEKRANREKLTDIKEDMMRYKMNKEEIWNRLGTGTGNIKSGWIE